MNWKVPFVDLKAQYQSLEDELLQAFKEVMSRGDFILRGQLSQFESDIASFIGVKHAVGVGSGTDALYLAVLAAGLGPGDEVITVTYTCVPTLGAIIHCGATPIPVDVGDDFNMNMEQVEQAISPRTRAILPVHLNGRSCNMEKLMTIARKHNLLVIEDAAQSPGAGFDGQKVGSFGVAGCFSVYPIKMLGATGDGGFVTTNCNELAEKIRLLRDLGQQRATGDILCYGFNSRLDNLHAAILNIKFKYLNKWIERRREVAGLYHSGLSELPYMQLPPPPQQGRFFDVYQNYVVRAQKRNSLVRYLNECGVETLTSWYLSKPLHYHPALGLGHFHLPKTEQFATETVSLPLNSEITNEQVEYVIECIHNFYQK